MAKMLNRAKMSVTSTGTGTLTLGSAVLGFQTFANAGVANGDIISYAIEDGTNWEIGTGTYTSAGTTLSRTVTRSFDGTTYGTSPISVTTSAQVFATALAADLVVTGGAAGTPSSITLTNGTGLPLTTGVTGTLPVANGGTGVTSLATGYIPYGNGTGAFNSSNRLVFDGAIFTLGYGNANQGLQIRPSAGYSGYIQFTENAVNDRWSIGCEAGSADFIWKTGAGLSGTERMRITSTGLVGVGTTSPSTILDVASSNSGITLTNTGATNKQWRIGGGSSGQFLITETGVADRLYLDTSGNIGLGVAPSAWGTSNIRAFQIGPSSAFFDYSSSGNRQSHYMNNAYYSAGGYTYLNTDAATRYSQIQGQHIWYQAPSGTASTAITFTQTMTLDPSGNLGIGTPSPAAKLQVAGGNIRIDNNQSIEWGGSNSFILGNNSTNVLSFYTNATLRGQFVSGSSTLALGTSAATNPGSVQLYGSTSGSVTVNTPAVAGTTTFTLPGSNGTSGYALTTNGSGVTSWSQVAVSTGISGLGTNVATALGNATNATGGVTTVDGTATLTNKTLTNPTVTNYTETAYSIGNSSTAVTISLANGTVQTVTMTGNCTFTMPTATAGKSFILIATQDATGSRTGTFTSVKWPSGSAPSLTTTASTGRDILTFISDGTNWYGTAAQAFA